MSSLHRAGLIALGFLGASAVVAACAGSDEATAELSPEDAGGGDRAAPAPVESGVADAGVDTNAPARDACSSAGWCSLGVDPQLSFDDLWPLADGSAVAISSRDGRSTVVLYEESSWRVIHEVPFVLESVWADSTDVWVSGGDPGYVAHGHRDGAAWKWSVRPIPVQATVPVVWATGEGEVYALADSRVWRLAGDGDWAVDFGADLLPDTTLAALTGTGKDDVWVTGGQGIFPACSIIAHKTGGAWVTVAEGTPDPDAPWPGACMGISSAAPLTGTAERGAATAVGELVAVVESDTNYVARVRHLPDGGIDVATSELPRDFSYPRDRQSIWGASANDLYIAGVSKVRRGRNVWADGGAWEISTVAYEGIPLGKPFYVVRGTRADDVWLAGESYVFHKANH